MDSEVDLTKLGTKRRKPGGTTSLLSKTHDMTSLFQQNRTIPPIPQKKVIISEIPGMDQMGKPAQMTTVSPKVSTSEVSQAPIQESPDQIATPSESAETKFKPFFMSQKAGVDGSIYYAGGRVRLIHEEGAGVFESVSLYFSFPSEKDAKDASEWVVKSIETEKKIIQYVNFEAKFGAKYTVIEKEELKKPIPGILFELILDGENISNCHYSRGSAVPIPANIQFENIVQLHDTVKMIEELTNKTFLFFMHNTAELSTALESYKLGLGEMDQKTTPLFQFATSIFTNAILEQQIKKFFPETYFISEIKKITDKFPTPELQQSLECQAELTAFLISDFFYDYPTLKGIFQINDLNNPREFLENHINVEYFHNLDLILLETSKYFLKVTGYFKNRLLQETHLLQEMGLNPEHVDE